MCLGEGTNDCRKMKRAKAHARETKECSRWAKVVSISGHRQHVKIQTRLKVVQTVRRAVRLAFGTARKVNCMRTRSSFRPQKCSNQCRSRSQPDSKTQ